MADIPFSDYIAPGGDWTPQLAGSGVAGAHTYTVNEGRYYVHAKACHFRGDIQVATFDPATTGNMLVVNLPVPTANVGVFGEVSIGPVWDITFDGYVSAYVANPDEIQLINCRSGLTAQGLSASAFVDGSRLMISGWYEIA